MTESESTWTSAGPAGPARASRRRKGRPLEMAPDELLHRIRGLGEQGGLFRVHVDHPALYARARRLFGSWAGALERAGLDHAGALTEARRRSVAARRARDPKVEGR
jgi:hypothetical protein